MFSVVRLSKAIHLDADRQGRGFGSSTSDAFKTNVLYSEDWELQKSGNSLLLKRKGTDFTHEIPWHHVDSALHEAEAKPAAKAGKAAGQ